MSAENVDKFCRSFYRGKLISWFDSWSDCEKLTVDNYGCYCGFCLGKVICDKLGQVRTSSSFMFSRLVVPTISLV